MKKSFLILVFVVFSSSLLFNSCEPEPAHWELKSKEFWGVKPDATEKYVQFGQFPFNISYTFGDGVYTYSGQEFSVTRSDLSKIQNKTTTINFTWSQLPTTILPDKEFNVTYQAKGDTGNGIAVSVPVYYNSGFMWKTASFRTGTAPVTTTLKTTAPDADPNHQKMKIGFSMSSGHSFYMEWVYVYEWVPESIK